MTRLCGCVHTHVWAYEVGIPTLGDGLEPHGKGLGCASILLADAPYCPPGVCTAMKQSTQAHSPQSWEWGSPVRKLRAVITAPEAMNPPNSHVSFEADLSPAESSDETPAWQTPVAACVRSREAGQLSHAQTSQATETVR